MAQPGAWIHIRQGRMLVEHATQQLASIPLDQVEAIRCVGPVQVSTAVVSHCLTRGVDLAFFSSGVRYRGRLDGLHGAAAARRVAQYASLLDERRTMLIARGFVQEKLEEQRRRLIRWRRLPGWPGHVRTLGAFDAARAHVGAANSIDELRGAEGAAARAYFSQFLTALEPSGRTLRRVHPAAHDLPNVLLNLGYSLLTADGVAAMAAAGLDPYLGWLHTPRAGRPSGALDLIEAVRPLAVDPVVLWLDRRRVIVGSDLTVSNGQGRLTPEALGRALGAFERRMQTRRVGPDGVRRTLRASLRRNAFTLAHELLEAPR